MTVKERIVDEIALLFDKQIDISEELTLDQLGIIFEGLLYGLDVIQRFACSPYDYDQMNEILDGMRKGIDTDIYSNPSYNYLQMKIIKDTLYDNLDANILLEDNYSWEQMYQLRLGLLDGLEG